MKNTSYTFIFLIFTVQFSIAQNVVNQAIVQYPLYFDVSPPLRSVAKYITGSAETSWKDGIVKNMYRNRVHSADQPAGGLSDPGLQIMNGTTVTDTTIVNFDGNSNTEGVLPPDTHGDVGLSDYVQVVNSHFSIYSKAGTLIAGPFPTSTLWNGMSNNSNDGDAVVLYDEQADRWLISQFSLPSYPNGPFYQMIAVSQTSDPTGTWYRYQYSFANMPDYPKFGVWPDGYYMSTHLFSSGSLNYAGVGAVAYNRTLMLAGSPSAAMIMFSLPSTSEAYGWLPSDCDGPFPTGNIPEYFIYPYDGVSNDHLGIYEFRVDWANPSNSTFGNFLSLPVNAFTSNITGITQPGTAIKLDPLNDRMMYRLQYRKFSDHSSIVCNHTVDVTSTIAGIRWYELRKSSGNWSVYQQGTYSPSVNDSRWMGSIAQDSSGNIALGYSVSGTVNPSVRYTGRMKNDALGQMTIAEKGIINGGGVQTYYQNGRPGRWGDYSAMSCDPSSNSTFWYTQEYYSTTSNVFWKTRIASFHFPSLPTAITNAATNITSSGATLNGSINPNGYATNWQFEWGLTSSYAFTTAMQPAGSGTTTIPQYIMLTGLTPGKTYHYRIDAMNSEGSSYGQDMSFATPCGVFSILPFFEGFESQASTPVCWSEDNAALPWLYVTGDNGSGHPAVAHTGTRNACLTDGTTSDNINDLVLPFMDLSLYNNVSLTFWHTQASRNNGRVDKLSVLYRNSVSGPWTQLVSYTNPITNWTEEIINLPNLSSTYQIEFQGDAKGGWGVCLDDVSVCAPGNWVGGYPQSPTAWETPSNWGDGTVPGSATDVYIAARQYLPVINSTTAVCNNMQIDHNAGLGVTISKKITLNGTLTIK